MLCVITPGHWANVIPIIFLSSLGSIPSIMCNLFWCCRADQTQLPQIYPHRFPLTLLGEEKQLQLSVLLEDTSTEVVAGIRTHILTTRPSEHKPDALDPSAMTPPNIIFFRFLRVLPEAVSTRHSWLWQTLDDVYTRRCFSESEGTRFGAPGQKALPSVNEFILLWIFA